MIIIKECSGERVAIRTDTYSHTLEHFLKLFEEAKKDFPKLDPKDVDVVEYAGDTYARTFGIEFSLKATEIPDSYRRVRIFEHTF